MDVDIDLIRPSPYQPRLFFKVDDLKEEIERDGLLSALLVRQKDEFYELLDGERRLRTLKELGWKRVPIDIRDVDDRAARRSVFKLNKIRESYNTEEEARYYKKLADEGRTAWEVSQELNVNFQWVLAHLNVFKFPEHIQKAVWEGKYLTVSHISALESTIGRNIDEALLMTSEIINRKLSVADTRKIGSDRDKEADKQRLEAAKEALPEVVGTLETPEDYEKAAQALKEEAKIRAEEAMTPETRAALEAEKQAKAEAQAAAKAKKEEEKRQRKAEEDRRRQERAEARAKTELKGDKSFVQEALKAMPYEERLEVLEMAPTGQKPRESKSFREQFEELIKAASQMLTKVESLRAAPGFHELEMKSIRSFVLDLQMLAEGFSELSRQLGLDSGHGEKK